MSKPRTPRANSKKRATSRRTNRKTTRRILRHVSSSPAARRCLREAADYIDEHGLYKAGLESPTGEVCALGAIARVAPDAAVKAEAIALLKHRLRRVSGRYKHNGVAVIWKWNNARQRTRGQVTRVMRRRD